MLTILGPTASGKTALAARVAYELNGEVISADSRQVYRGMDIGTGKDYDDYVIEGKPIPYHMVDIAEPGSEYNIFRYQQDFLPVYHDIIARGKLPILCGGSGMYLDAVLKGYRLTEVRDDLLFRKSLEDKTEQELTGLLKSWKTLHNKTDLEDRTRLIRAIEIEHKARFGGHGQSFPAIPSSVFGIGFPRGLLKKRITDRLRDRLVGGMTEEIERLIIHGVSPDKLMHYGLEYKFGTLFITGQITGEELFNSLNKAIHQFSKRQMTWFRRMERQGIKIQWIDGRWPMKEKMVFIKNHINQ
ncbi:MAG: tRNA (adenosine(37)-N6)-dimethylallyltransferase MiaA [Bacteroidales bacterium]|jgi:tRNA dimethylallyltransferase|nr:tRNA (adenosine(37)-N6)-dimethylallyltransferase MiaA [Bacteroidales bacterium]